MSPFKAPIPMPPDDKVDISPATKTEAPQPDTIKLALFRDESSVAYDIQQTAKYASDPKAYLTNILGEETVQARRHLLHIPSTLTKDVYGAGESKEAFETHIAKLLGKSHGLFFQTGVQAQLSAMKIYCQRAGRNLVAWHVSCHLESAEMVSYKELYGLDRVLLGADRDKLATVDEMKAVLKLPEAGRPVAIVLELPNRNFGCETYTFAELEELSAACAKANVKLHLDGARLWEIEPHYQATDGKTFADAGALFDSVYVSFYKGLGGATGAMLISNDNTFVDEAKIWQRRAGGNAYSMTYYTTDCQRGFNENIGTFEEKKNKMIEVAEQIIEKTKEFKAEDGKAIIAFRPSPPTCCQTHTIFHGFTSDELTAARDKVQEISNIRIFERLRPKVTVDELLAEGGETKKDNAGSYGSVPAKDDTDKPYEEQDRTHFMEWSINTRTEKLPTDVFVDGYVKLCEQLMAAKK